MTINDQIRDEKLQYDIHREAAKISALSSGKINKHKYLTGEDILLSNQQQIIKQAKFTYFPLGKAFEKQIRTIEDQGQKQVDALKDLKPKEKTKTITYDDGDESLNQKETYNILFDKKLIEIRKLSKEIDYRSLIYNFTTKYSGSINFIKFIGPFSLFKELKNRNISLEKSKKDQEKFKREFGQIKSGNPKHKSEMQLYIIKNIKNLYMIRDKNY